MFLAPVFGYLGDRYNRKLIMCVGIGFWSVVTLASSFVGKDVSSTLKPCTLLCCLYNVFEIFKRLKMLLIYVMNINVE